MKNYIKPAAEVVELSVRESLSRIPVGLSGVAAPTFTKTQKILASTTYTVVLSDMKSNYEASKVQG